jgi:hypothetical protein
MKIVKERVYRPIDLCGDFAKYDSLKNNNLKRGKDTLLEVFTTSTSKLFKINPKMIGKDGEKIVKGAIPFLKVSKRKTKIDFGNVPKKEIKIFLSRFKREIHEAFRKNPELHDLKIKSNRITSNVNVEKWDAYEVGRAFYHLDIKNGYWQMLHRLGYISTKLYEEYLWDDNFKHLKRLCVTFLARKSHSVFYGLGIDGTNHEIYCDNAMYDNIYKNVRACLTNCLFIGLDVIGDDYFKYAVDGVYLHKDQLVPMKTKLHENGVMYKYTLCRKVGENQFIYNLNPNDIRNMKKVTMKHKDTNIQP